MMVRPVRYDLGWHTPQRDPSAPMILEGGIEVTVLGDTEPRFITPYGVPVPKGTPRWTEWCISQSRASYLAGMIFWWQLEDEVWDALNGRFPSRLGIAPGAVTAACAQKSSTDADVRAPHSNEPPTRTHRGDV